MNKKWQLLQQRLHNLQMEVEELQGFVLSHLPTGSIEDFETWLDKEEKRLIEAKEIIKDAQSEWLTKLQQRYTELQKKAQGKLHVSEFPTGGWNAMEQWLNEKEHELENIIKEENQDLLQDLLET